MLHTLLAINISSGAVNPHFGSQKGSKCPFLAKTLTKYIEKLKLIMQKRFMVIHDRLGYGSSIMSKTCK